MNIFLLTMMAASLEFGLKELPEDSKYRQQGFVKYTEVTVPNGMTIPIIAQAGVRDIAVARARNLLKFFLTDVPQSKYGNDKSKVANTMAINKAMLMMPEGAHREGNEPEIEAQPLYEDETPIDGSTWYIQNDWNHRDAAFEEIFHLVHDTGIGTYMRGALPDYQRTLKIEAIKAMREKRWGISIDPHVNEWIEELAKENSLAQEYIAAVIDSYYGLWGAFDENLGGMWGIYIAKTRDEINEKDPKGKELIEAFLPPMMVGYESLIDPSFMGTFTMYFKEDLPYTHKSQYLVDVTLTGNKNANVFGNDADNTIKGNQGNNIINGGNGEDTVIFQGNEEEYEMVKNGNAIRVTDLIQNRDGTDTLLSIESIQFATKLKESEPE